MALPRDPRESSSSAQPRNVRVLVVTAPGDDAAAVLEALAAAAEPIEARTVAGGDALRHAVGVDAFDLVVAVDQPPACDALETLKTLIDAGVETPCIAVFPGDDVRRAVELMRAGARDGISGQRLERLGPAAERELRSARDRATLHRNEAEQRALAERLGFALEASQAGWWEWDVASGENAWSSELFRLYDLDPATTRPSYEAWRSAIHPDDVAAVEQEVRRAAAAGAELTIEWRVRSADAGERWLLSRGRPIPGPGGRPARYLGIAIDVTAAHLSARRTNESERRFEVAFRSMPLAMSLTRLADGTILDVNEAYATLVGRRREEMLGRKVVELGIFDDPAVRNELLKKLADEGRIGGFELALRRTSGEQRMAKAFIERVEVGGEPCAISLVDDVTERRQDEEALRESEAMLRTLFDVSPLGLEIFDRDGVLRRCNRRVSELFGVDMNGLIGTFDLRHEANHSDPETWSRLDRGEEVRHEIEVDFSRASRLPTRSGTARLAVTATPVPSSVSEAIGFIVQVEDISDRERTRAALVRALDLLETAQGIAHVGSFEYVAASQTTEWSAEEYRIYGLDPAQPSPPYEVMLERCIHPDDAALLHATFTKAMQERSVYELEHRIVRPDGSVRWVHDLARPYLDERGELVRYVGTTIDITERKQTEHALRASEARLRRFYDSPLLGVIYWNMDGGITDANERFLEIVGYTRAELEAGSVDWGAMTPPEWRARDEESVAELKATGFNQRPFEKEYIRKDGSRVPILVAGAMLDDRRQEGVAFVLDTTEKKRAEDDLRASERRLRRFFESPLVGAIFWNVDGRITDANDHFLEMVGYSREELAAGEVSWASMTPPEYRAMDEAAIAELQSPGGTSRPYEKEYIRKDGTRVPILIAAAALDGLHDGGVAFVLDISEQKRAEAGLRALNLELDARVQERTEQLETANRELESFSYSVSHDLRAPLRAVDGFSRLLEEEHAGALDAEGLRLLGVIRRSTQRMAQLIDDLLTFSRVGRAEMRRVMVDMRSLVESAWAEARDQADGHRAELALGALAPAYGDPNMLRQVWLNLLSNALKFSAASEHPRVEVRADREDGTVVYRVGDNGVGFDMRYAGKLFGVFQRLHSVNEFPGTGVGLALVHRIVARHGGRVSAIASPGQGATFSFSLGPPPGAE